MSVKLSQIEINLTKIIENYTERKNIHLFMSYYRDKNMDRDRENILCVKLNTSNKLFSKIFIMNEGGHELEFIKNSERINVINTSRPRFVDFFTYSNTCTSDDTINILINTDIVIGENFDNIKLETNQMICLSRYDVMKDYTYKVNVGGGSHDCWIWKGKIIDTIGNFYMGKMLCDGVLANQLAYAYYILKNPMRDLKIYHIHLSNIRNYDWNDAITGHRSGIVFSRNDGHFVCQDLYWDGCN